MENEKKQPEKRPTGTSGREILHYLEGNLPDQDRRALEESLTDDDFGADAVEGLNALNNNKQAALIHARLQQKINKKIQHKNKKLLPLGFPLWIVLLISVLLLAALAGYVLVTFLGK